MAERNVFKEEAAAAEALMAARSAVATTVGENLEELRQMYRESRIDGEFREALGDIIAAHNAWKLASERFAQAVRAVEHATGGLEV